MHANELLLRDGVIIFVDSLARVILLNHAYVSPSPVRSGDGNRVSLVKF